MAEVIVYHDERYGPAQLWTLPPGATAVPRTAYIPQGPFRLAESHLLDKGSGESWRDWADTLAGTLPYQVRYTIETVPDNLTPQAALSLIRERTADQLTG